MKSFFKHTAPALALLGLSLGSCKPDLEDSPKSSAGQADFSRYIAVGNSLTAGFSDGGLYLEGQQTSYPNIMAGQFKAVGGGDFTQPLFTDAQSNGSGYLRLAGFTAGGLPITANVTTSLAVRGGTAAAPLYTKFTTPINNLGVPGIRMSDILTPGYGSTAGNPYFERITLDTTPLQTYLARVQATVTSINPTFFTEWLGNNDVLGFATAGGGANSLTPLATFTTNTGLVLDALTAGGAKGVVATIPDVTGIPFFTTVGPSFRATLAAANVPSAAPFVYTTGILAPSATPGANARVSSTLASIRDAAGSGNLLLTLTASPYVALYGQPTGRYWRDFYRQATGAAPTGPVFSGFLLGLGVDTTRAFGQSTGNPFPSILVLDGTEQTAVATATTAFNSALTTAANSRNLAVFDANTFFRTVATNGFVTNGVTNTAGFVSGNLFGLDGVHPTPRGYAVVANEMIKALNAKYGSAVPGVDPTRYRGVRFPQ